MSLTLTEVSPRITPGFNAALFATSAALGVFSFLLGPGAKGVPVGGLLLTVLLDLARYLAVALVTAGFLAAFWRRLITCLAPVRPLEFQEALAAVLLAGLVLGH